MECTVVHFSSFSKEADGGVDCGECGECQLVEKLYVNEMQTFWTADNRFEVEAVWSVISISKSLVLKSYNCITFFIIKLDFKCSLHTFIVPRMAGLTKVY